MKRQRVTLELVLDIPIDTQVSKYIKISGGETVINRSLKIISTEELPEELLESELRRGSKIAIKKTIDVLIEKLGMNKYIYLKVSNYERGAGFICDFVPRSRVYHAQAWLSVIINSNSQIERGFDDKKVIATLADPELKDLSQVIINHFGTMLRKIKRTDDLNPACLAHIEKRGKCERK